MKALVLLLALSAVAQCSATPMFASFEYEPLIGFAEKVGCTEELMDEVVA